MGGGTVNVALLLEILLEQDAVWPTGNPSSLDWTGARLGRVRQSLLYALTGRRYTVTASRAGEVEAYLRGVDLLALLPEWAQALAARCRKADETARDASHGSGLYGPKEHYHERRRVARDHNDAMRQAWRNALKNLRTGGIK